MHNYIEQSDGNQIYKVLTLVNSNLAELPLAVDSMGKSTRKPEIKNLPYMTASHLLERGKTWEWSKRCQTAFEGLKEAVTEEPILALPDHTKVFELQTNASDFAIGGVLMQEGHPIAFESRKLNDTEWRYTVQEKKMTAVIHCLRTWRHYLLGSQFLIKTDNIATSYFQSQKKLSPKQVRWQDFLAEFDYPLTPLALAGDYKGRSPLAAQVARSWQGRGTSKRTWRALTLTKPSTR
ncbi:hypothetical protein RJ639_027289 [Escallonia herrerae]|uniref:Reverse transcriptase/retrotransposon-derived protein RNase H-like domain-containing protein n=1 Tax=Escallonia herrerae TaxID=1293975 RepID=A0AA89BNZ9_9ASTE|nr:hypothetical protein RJ639_027289 [Escallonia herrerae]